MIDAHLKLMIVQLVDSRIEATRIHWRRMIGLPEKVIRDPRALSEIAAAQKAPSP